MKMHVAIVSSIPSEDLPKSVAFKLPAMNVDDRVELLGGIRETAPAPAFEGVVGLARSVLEPAEFAAMAQRLAID
jgi:hypothetical protein